MSVRKFSVGVALLGAVVLAIAPASAATAAPVLEPSLGGWVDANDSAPFSFALTGVTWDNAAVTIELADGRDRPVLRGPHAQCDERALLLPANRAAELGGCP